MVKVIFLQQGRSIMSHFVIGRSDVAKYLIDIKADVTVVDRNGQFCMTYLIMNSESAVSIYFSPANFWISNKLVIYYTKERVELPPRTNKSQHCALNSLLSLHYCCAKAHIVLIGNHEAKVNRSFHIRITTSQAQLTTLRCRNRFRFKSDFNVAWTQIQL